MIQEVSRSFAEQLGKYKIPQLCFGIIKNINLNPPETKYFVGFVSEQEMNTHCIYVKNNWTDQLGNTRIII